MLVLPAKITYKSYKTNHDACTKVFELNQKILQRCSLTGSWDVVTGECGCALCSNVKLFQPVTFCSSWTEITVKNGLNGEIFFAGF